MFNFKNIGNKIKILATIIAIIGSITSVIYGIILIFKTNYDIEGILWLIIGPIASWISCFVLYGFGQLVDNSDKLVETKNINNVENKTIITEVKNNKKANTNTKTNPNNDINKANEFIKHLSLQDFENLKNKHKKWTLEINKLSTSQLLNIIDKEKDEWEDDYIYLCCFEILERKNAKE